MSRTTQVIERLCNDKFPSKAVDVRKNGNGKELSYASQHYVITRLNTVFGPMGWSSETVYNNLVAEDITQRDGKSRWEVSHEAKVRIYLNRQLYTVYHDGTGHGHGFGAKKGDAIESSAKEAETDALKRAARLLGPSFGLALYDPEQKDVGDPLFDDDGRYLPDAINIAITLIEKCEYVPALHGMLDLQLRPLLSRVNADSKKLLITAYKTRMAQIKEG